MDDPFRLDRSAFTIVSSHEEAAEADRRYWHSKTPHERLRMIQYLRRLNYGEDRATARLQRILEVTSRASG